MHGSGGGARASPPRYSAPRACRTSFRRHAEIKQAMGFRHFMSRGVTKVRDGDLALRRLNLRRLRARGVAAA